MPEKSFFFYDLETTGLRASEDRIMQFAGQRTNENLEKIGDEYNFCITVNDDTLPSPDALLVTGITPQKTVEEGYSESEASKIIAEEIFTPGTIAVGFNNIRFDDEFIRHLFWRNFYDPYEWAWADGRSRWDILDVVRMTRALRPEGINWPVVNGRDANKLELLSKENGLEHENAHDAMSDVRALIDVARLVREKQPKLFDYLLSMRDKNQVKELVNLEEKRPFVYTSGRYGTDFGATTVALPITSGRNGNVVVYDLRYDPAPFIGKSINELRKNLYATKEDRAKDGYVRLPVKELQYNRSPAVAPVSVLRDEDMTRLSLDKKKLQEHQALLMKNPHFAENIRTLVEERPEFPKNSDVEGQLYDSFVPSADKIRVEAVRNADGNELADFHPNFLDERLPELLLRYKGRNYPGSLTESETLLWESWRSKKIMQKIPSFMARLAVLMAEKSEPRDQYILEELKLWAENVMPVDLDTN